MKHSAFLLLLPCAFVARRADASALLKPASGVSVALSPKSLALDTRLSGAFAQTTVTTIYANPNSQQIEADFIYSAPKGSVVTGFAYWYQGEKVVARVVEKGRAAKIYSYITSRMRDPALIEMIGPNRFRARIFPVEARADLKIEVQLAQKLDQTPSGPLWTWPLREETQANPLAHLSVHVRSEEAFSSNLGAVKSGALNFERRNFRATGNARVLVPQPKALLRASLIGARDGGADGFFALSLSSSVPVASPRLQISGVKTFEVLVPTVRRLGANTSFVVLGRYRGSGAATVSLNGRSVAVRFPDARQERNLPELLWASARMESLSGQARNQGLVTALSQRFGMPSKWTSWLAIPEEERRNFKRQMMASDRAEAARAYAQAVSRGDGGAMKSQKVVFDDLTGKMKALGSNYAEAEELQPLDSYLNDELRRLQSAVLQAKYDPKISKSQSAQWASWAKNLERAGASSGGQGVDLPVYVVEDELRIASRLYLIEVEAGRKKGARAKKMQARLKELAATKTAKQYGWGETTFLGEQAEARANALSMEIATNRASDKPNHKAEVQARARLARLNGEGEVNADDALQNALQQVWGQKIEVAANGWAKEIQAGRTRSDVARRYAREVRQLQARSGIKDVARIRQAWEVAALETGIKAAPRIVSEGPQGATARQLDNRIAALSKESGLPAQGLRNEAWQPVAHELNSKWAQQIVDGGGETEQTRLLESQLDIIEKTRRVTARGWRTSAWSEAAKTFSEKLATEIRAGRESEPSAQLLEKRVALARQKAGDTTTNWKLRQAWNDRARQVATKVVVKALDENQLAPDDALVAQGKTLVEKGGQGSFDQLLVPAASQQLAELQAQIAAEIAAKRENGPKIAELRARIAQGQKLFPGATPQSYNYYNYQLGSPSEEFAWEGRAHEAAYRLLDAQKSAPANTAQLAKLQAELAQSAKNAGKKPDDVLKWEAKRLAKNEPLVSASDYRLRPGDPLISVVAPADCKSVVAIMPDGTLLPLAWNAGTKSFEARFDVPAFAPEGDYQVQIILVGEDGRHILTMRFAVDLKSPSASGTVRRAKDVWHLSLRSDDQTERVSAFTPWNARVELKRNENDLFVGEAPVPADWLEDAGVTRFVVTDKAHNRTEISLDSH
jgi:hypothetical protein